MFTFRKPATGHDAVHAIRSFDGGFYIAVFDDNHRRHDVTLPTADAERLRDYLISRYPLAILPLPVEEPVAEEPAPAAMGGLKVGDRVRLVSREGDHGSRARVGDVGVVESLRPDVMCVEVKMSDGHTTTRFLSRFEAAPLDVPGDPVGSVVYVTGHTHDDGDALGTHRFEVGEEVEIVEAFVEDEVATHPHFLCRNAAGGEWYVYEHDLDVEPPFVPVPVATFVRVTNNGAAHGLRHFLAVGSIARVAVVARDASGPYRLSGTLDNGRPGGQYLTAASFEVAE